MKKHYLILILILVLGLLLRTINLSNTPNGLTWDEAALGYNAYSIFKTGRDEHGTLLPIIFKSFGDYKPGLYVYLTVPFVAIFGLSEASVRLPSALMGTFLIYVIYLLTNKIYTKNKNIGLFSAFVMAVMPWAVHFSRGAWEVNVFVSILALAILYYLKFIKGESSIFPALVLASLTLILYQAAKLLTPLLFLVTFFIYYRQSTSRLITFFKSKQKKYLIFFLIFGIWLIYTTLFSNAGNRLATLSIFGYKPELANTYYDNQVLLKFKLIMSRYFYHFSPEVLFYEGARIVERAHIPGTGLLNPIELLPILFGLYFISKKFSKKSRYLLFSLLILSPIPASLTLAEYSPLRALFMIVPLSIISGCGLYFLWSQKKKIFFTIIAFYLLFGVYVFDLYFAHSRSTFAFEFNDGHKQAVQIIKDHPTSKVIFTDVYGQPYIYYLFYTNYDPRLYQSKNDFQSGGLDVGRVGHVGNVEFHQFGKSELSLFHDTLFIGTEGNINRDFDIASDSISYFKQIETSDNKIIFRSVITK